MVTLVAPKHNNGSNEQKQLKAEETKVITFRCRLCGKEKPIDEMKILTRFRPPIVACRDCERKWP